MITKKEQLHYFSPSDFLAYPSRYQPLPFRINPHPPVIMRYKDK
jgi:hypothetical protein